MFTYRFNMIVVLILVVTLFSSESGNARAYKLNKRQTVLLVGEPLKKYCGPKLTEMVKIACKGVYNSPSSRYSEKKSISDSLYGLNSRFMENRRMDLDDYGIIYDKFAFPFMSRIMANSFRDNVGRRRRRGSSSQKPGIVQECCDKACSMEELKTYCGDPSDT